MIRMYCKRGPLKCELKDAPKTELPFFNCKQRNQLTYHVKNNFDHVIMIRHNNNKNTEKPTLKCHKSLTVANLKKKKHPLHVQQQLISLTTSLKIVLEL
jgi:hypothetical protein